MSANSTPMAPAPTMAMDLGAWGSTMASVLVSTRVPSGARPGRALGREPVASRTRAARSVSFTAPPSPSPRPPEEPHHLGVPEEGLGGDAAPVEADPSQLVRLHDGHLLPELGGADG